MNNLKILDVTLRDGGCVNNFNFVKKKFKYKKQISKRRKIIKKKQIV